MISEITSIFDVIFFEKRYRLLKILFILAISIAFVWLLAPEKSDQRTKKIESLDITVTSGSNGVMYASDKGTLYAFLPEMYFQIPEVNDCPNFNPQEFTTWCKEGTLPHTY